MQDWCTEIDSTEIQYPLLGHFFNEVQHGAFVQTCRCTEIQSLQYCEEIVYFSRDFSTTFIQYMNIPKSRRTSWSQHGAFSCAKDSNLTSAEIQYLYIWCISSLEKSVSLHSCTEIQDSFATSSISVPQLDSLLFSTTFIQYMHIPKSRRTSWSQTDAFFVQDWNRCTENQYPLLGHFFNFSATAVKR